MTTPAYNVPTTKDGIKLIDHLWMDNGGYANITTIENICYMWQSYFGLEDSLEQSWSLGDLSRYYRGLIDGHDPVFAEELATNDIPF